MKKSRYASTCQPGPNREDCSLRSQTPTGPTRRPGLTHSYTNTTHTTRHDTTQHRRRYESQSRHETIDRSVRRHESQDTRRTVQFPRFPSTLSLLGDGDRDADDQTAELGSDSSSVGGAGWACSPVRICFCVSFVCDATRHEQSSAVQLTGG